MWSNCAATAIPRPKIKKTIPPTTTPHPKPSPPAKPALIPPSRTDPYGEIPRGGDTRWMLGGGADEEWSVSEGVVVETWNDGLGEGECYMEVEEWLKKGKGKKKKSKAMYASSSALFFKDKEEAEAYLRSRWGTGRTVTTGMTETTGTTAMRDGMGIGTKVGMGESPLPRACRLRTWGCTAAHQQQGTGRVQGRGRVKGKD